MNEDSLSELDPLNNLAEEFLTRHRRGEGPAVSEYETRYPDLAERIRALFPALLLVEELGSPSRPTAAPTAVMPLLQLGEYRLVREIGRGGMGIVYEAVQESLGRRVAVKVLAPHLRHGKFLERFRREAKSAARLHHTNIVPVFGVGDHDGQPYYVMQFIDSRGLDAVLADRKTPVDASTPTVAAPRSPLDLLDSLSPEPKESAKRSIDLSLRAPFGMAAKWETSPADMHRAAQLGLQAAEALAYAHAQGVLHRDIKPANLLLDKQGTLWIADFGLAKADDSDDLTEQGGVVGTLRYLAPERFQGQCDARADVYALGVTLYEMLTLRPAFDALDRASLLDQIARRTPTPPRRLAAAIPHDLETIVLKAMAHEPAQRYATAEALAEDLRCFLADRPIKAKRTSQLTRLRLWCRRNPAVASLLAAVVGLLATVAVVSTLSAVRLGAALTRTEKAERAARLREAEALVGEAHGIRNSRRPGQRFAALAALQKAAAIGRELGQSTDWFNRLRNETIAALALPDIHITQEFGSFPPDIFFVELNDDFTLYARTTKKGGCIIRRVADDGLVAQLPELGEPAIVRFGAGAMLAVRGQPSLRFQLWDVSATSPALRFAEQSVVTWQFRSDGVLLGLAHRDGSISIYDVAANTRRHRLPPTEAVRERNEPKLCLHPREPFVATFSYFKRVVQVRDLRSGAIVASALPPWSGGNGGCAWSPDGRTLLVPQGDGGKIQEFAFDPAAPALRPARAPLQSPIDQGCPYIAFHPAGDRFAARGWSGAVSLFDAVSGRMLLSTPIQLYVGNWETVRFDRSGERLAAARVGTQNDRIGLWSLATGREYRYLVHKRTSEFRAYHDGPVVHPDGRLAAIGLTDGVALFDLETGSELGHIPSGNVSTQFDGAGNLFTNGFEGFFRWPVRPDPANSRRLVIGPPERLPFHPGDRQIAASRDGRVVAQSMWAGYGMGAYAGGWIRHPNAAAPRWVSAGGSTVGCSVSPDGRWAAFGISQNCVAVYEAASGKCVWQSPVGENVCRFSPDGRWLLTNVDNGRAYAVGTWEPGPQLGAGTPYDATSELAVLGQANGIYRLVELATGRELAQLEDPEQSSRQAVFTPDGTKLIVAAEDGLRVWDLRLIRTELANRGLDWHAPPLPAAPAAAGAPLSIHLERTDFQGKSVSVPAHPPGQGKK